MKYLLLIFLSFLSILSCSQLYAAPSPWQLNLYAINNFGSAAQAYSGSDVEGLAGAGGNVYLSSFSINLNNTLPGNPFSLYAGGSVNWNSGQINNGGIAAGSNVNINSVTVQGGVNSGGNLTGSSGTITGNVNLSGSNQAGPGLVINGSVQTNVPYTAPLNLAAVTQFFQNASNVWANATANATYVNFFGQLQISNLQSGRNVVNISASDYNSAWGIKVNGPSDAYLIVNILGNSFTNLAPLSLDTSGSSLTSNSLLLNLPNVTQLSINGSVNSSLLAPNANLTISGGVLTGNVVAFNINGSSQINAGSFLGFSSDPSLSTPEPATYLFLGSALLLIVCLQKRRHLVA